MKRTSLIVAFVLLFLTMAMSSAYAYEAFYGPSELIYWDKEKAYNGYSLIGGYLIDMEGNLCHRFSPGGELFEDGTLYGTGGMEFAAYTRDGKVIFDLEETRQNYHPHHSSKLIYNKVLKAHTVLYVANKDLTHDEVIAAGANPTWSEDYSRSQMDCLVERDQNNNVVWEWWFYDHLIQDLDPTKDNYVGKGKKISDYPGKMDINWGKPLRRGWNHVNAVDYGEESGHIVFDQVTGEAWIIDHDGTFVSTQEDFAADPVAAAKANIAAAASDAGDFLWRFGDPAMYGQGEKPKINENYWMSHSTGHKELGGVHDAQFIKPGLPGAGNVLFYNNGHYLYHKLHQSNVREINPYIAGIDEKTGKPIISDSYVNPPDAGYFMSEEPRVTNHRESQRVSNQTVWYFMPIMSSGMFSDNGGNCIRLPNGNTIASNKTEGHWVEITPEGEVVWEYINPVCRDGIRKIIKPGDLDQHSAGRMFRYKPDYPGLKGLDLTPQGTLTDLAAQGKIQPPSGKGKGDKRSKGGKRGKK